MWWVPLLTAVILACLFGALYYWHQRKQFSVANTYRARYVQLVAQLDTLTGSVNQLGTASHSVREVKLLDYYESTLRILETLLAAITKIPPFGSDPTVLDSAFYLVRDCRHRVGRTQQAFQDHLRGRQVKIDELYGVKRRGDQLPQATGCYFCSRPMIANRFSKVKVKLEGKVMEVVSCRICKEELENTKKVKVLYFMKDGRQVHWSEVKDYQPSEDFWNINKRDVIRKTPKLELVFSSTQSKITD
jgi:hypothetical protein